MKAIIEIEKIVDNEKQTTDYKIKVSRTDIGHYELLGLIKYNIVPFIKKNPNDKAHDKQN